MVGNSRQLKVIVKNSFVETVLDAEQEDDADLFRSMSDPIGGYRDKHMTWFPIAAPGVRDGPCAPIECEKGARDEADAIEVASTDSGPPTHEKSPTPESSPKNVLAPDPAVREEATSAADAPITAFGMTCLSLTSPATVGACVAAPGSVASPMAVAPGGALAFGTAPAASCPQAPEAAFGSAPAVPCPPAPVAAFSSAPAGLLGFMSMQPQVGVGAAPPPPLIAMAPLVPVLPMPTLPLMTGVAPPIAAPVVGSTPKAFDVPLGQHSAPQGGVSTHNGAMPPWPCPAPEPAFGALHRFHEEVAQTGIMSPDARTFTKLQFAGLLSVITEDQVRSQGVQRYALQFTQGRLSSADGVGFILSPRLPCSKNIQRIVSIFVNRSGRICLRAHHEVVRFEVGVEPFEIGDWVCLTVDLARQTAKFSVWPSDGGAPSQAELCFGAEFEGLRRRVPGLPASMDRGYFACVIKNSGVSVRLGS